MHCDLKSSNILVEGDKTKLCDFGLAKIKNKIQKG